jgi:hypothetical protein
LQFVVYSALCFVVYLFLLVATATAIKPQSLSWKHVVSFSITRPFRFGFSVLRVISACACPRIVCPHAHTHTPTRTSQSSHSFSVMFLSSVHVLTHRTCSARPPRRSHYARMPFFPSTPTLTHARALSHVRRWLVSLRVLKHATFLM